MSGLPSFRVLVTGSRHWTDRQTIADALQAATAAARADRWTWEIVVVHGGARGADTLADDIARTLGMRTERHPADWGRHGRAAGWRRNADMVAAGADLCLAFPIGESRGTRGCIELAKKAGIPVTVHEGPAGPHHPAGEHP